MGRPRQPVDLLLIKGKKHLTKREIEERRSCETKGFTDKIKAPDYLPNVLKEEFDDLAGEIMRLNLLSNLDVDTLARFILSRRMYLQLTQDILKNKNLLLDSKVLTNQDKLFKQCRLSAIDLGLTISSRCKLMIPNTNVELKENKFNKFMG